MPRKIRVKGRIEQTHPRIIKGIDIILLDTPPVISSEGTCFYYENCTNSKRCDGYGNLKGKKSSRRCESYIGRGYPDQ